MLTFVIPVGRYHLDIAERAVQSVLAQSLYCHVVVVYDLDGRGAGWARNRGMEHVNTPFVAFLDSDDWIAPDFAENCLRAYDARHYIFTDWVTDRVIAAPCRPWDGSGAAHLVTTLLPTIWVNHVGGFDETLPGLEDTDLYWKLTRSGLCGKRLPEALFHYGKGGLRAQAFKDRPDREQIAKSIVERYKGKTMPCGDCGAGNLDIPNFPANQPQDGDVLAQSLWLGNRQERGRVTGRLYPRSSNGKQLWMQPADIDAAPHLFARVVEMPPALDDAAIEQFRRVAGQALNVQDAPYAPLGTVLDAAGSAPDVARVLRLYDQRAVPNDVRPEWADGIPR